MSSSTITKSPDMRRVKRTDRASNSAMVAAKFANVVVDVLPDDGRRRRYRSAYESGLRNRTGSAIYPVLHRILCHSRAGIQLLVASGRGLLKALRCSRILNRSPRWKVLQKFGKILFRIEDFYDKAMKVFSQIDDLSADLQDLMQKSARRGASSTRYTPATATPTARI